MPVEIKIVRKEGFVLNPDDNVVNNIFRALEKTNGHCLSKHKDRIGHDQCPCSQYLQKGECYCGLYIKSKDKTN